MRIFEVKNIRKILKKLKFFSKNAIAHSMTILVFAKTEFRADMCYVWYKKRMRTLSADYKYDNKSPKKSVKILDTRASHNYSKQQTA